jgi:hypothetical protein
MVRGGAGGGAGQQAEREAVLHRAAGRRPVDAAHGWPRSRREGELAEREGAAGGGRWHFLRGGALGQLDVALHRAARRHDQDDSKDQGAHQRAPG